jgi:hypothetical protein
MTHLGKRLSLFLAGTILHLGAVAAPDAADLSFIDGLPFTTVMFGARACRLLFVSGGALGLWIRDFTVMGGGWVTLLDTKARFRDLQGKVFEVPKLVARQVVVGTTDLGQVEGQIHTQWGGAGEGPEAELTKAREAGAIGLAAFGDRPLMFDYAKGRMVIYAPGEGPQAGKDGWIALPLAYGKEGPNVSLRVDGKQYKLVLDTGTPVNLVDKVKVPAPACQGCDPRQLGELRDEAGRPFGALTAMRIDLNGAPFDGILGAPFFRAHRVLIDVAGGRLLIAD